MAETEELNDFQQVRHVLLNLVENLTLNGGFNNADVAKVHFDGATEQIIALRTPKPTVPGDGSLFRRSTILEFTEYRALLCNAFVAYHGQEEGEDPDFDDLCKREKAAEDKFWAAIASQAAAAQERAKKALLDNPHEYMRRRMGKAKPFEITQNGCHLHMTYVVGCERCKARYPNYESTLVVASEGQSATIECPTCHGYGEVYKKTGVISSIDPDLWATKTCPQCNGTKMVAAQPKERQPSEGGEEGGHAAT